MKAMELEPRPGVQAPRPETIDLPGFFRATNGDVCINYCGTLISVSKISGSDAVRISSSTPDGSHGLFSTDWAEECSTHEKMMEWIRKMCRAAYDRSHKC